ncbi:MAG: serine hydrolase domain-containing protein [Gemmatimonadaceae bacterium]
MRRSFIHASRVAALLVATSFTPPAHAQSAARPPLPGRYAKAIARARTIVRDSLAANGSPGVSIAVAVDGIRVWEEGFGFADLEQRVPVTPQTTFRIGSVSKSLTSIALGLLVQGGQIDLDAEVQRYAPSFPRKPWPVTVRQVGGHIAGIRHYNGLEYLSAKHYDNVSDPLAIFQDDSLLFEPGTNFNYSSYGFNLLSAVVEGAAKEPFVRAMQSRVIAALGMTNTLPDFPDSLVAHRTRFYDREGKGAWQNSPYVDQSNKWAGGGFLSTPSDLLLLGGAVMRPGLLTPETIATLTTSQRTRDGKETGYGIGWFVAKDSTGRRMVFHSGGSVGGTTHLVTYPDQGVAVSMAVNAGGEVWIGTGTVPREVAQLFLTEKARR